MLNVGDLVHFRLHREIPSMDVSPPAKIPIGSVTFVARAYSGADNIEHLALVLGHPSEIPGALVRVHSECMTGDIFGSARCDCGNQLTQALHRIIEQGAGVLIYLRGHEGSGIGLVETVHGDKPLDSGLTLATNLCLGLPADARDYSPAAAILIDLGVSVVRLMTNNLDKCRALEAAGLIITERVPLHAPVSTWNFNYLVAKRDRFGHLFEELERPRSNAAV